MATLSLQIEEILKENVQLKEEKAELEKKLLLAKKELEEFQEFHMKRLYEKRSASLQKYENEYENKRRCDD